MSFTEGEIFSPDPSEPEVTKLSRFEKIINYLIRGLAQPSPLNGFIDVNPVEPKDEVPELNRDSRFDPPSTL